jgi:hypothetical protein
LRRRRISSGSPGCWEASRVPIQRTYPLEEAGAALDDLAGAHTLGKVAIAIA